MLPVYDTVIYDTVEVADIDDSYVEIRVDTLTSQYGCDSIVTVKTYYKSGIDDIRAENLIKIYPNPAKEVFTLDLGGLILDGTDVITVINSTGQVVYTSNIQYQKTDIDISSLQSGVYYIRIGKTVKKLIVFLNRDAVYRPCFIVYCSRQ